MEIHEIVLIVFYLTIPALILYLCKKFSIAKKIGSVVIAYAIGIILGFSGLLPESSFKIQEWVSSLSIPLAIPLLLFPSKINEWSKLAGSSFKSLLVGLISVIFIVFIGFLIFRTEAEDFWKVGALLIGVYTGGTPNLASIKEMLDISNEVYLVIHSYDMVFSTIYFLFLITIGKRFFLLFLPPFKQKAVNFVAKKEDAVFDKVFNKNAIGPVLKVTGMALLIFVISAGIASLLPKSFFMIAVILSISTLALFASLFKWINSISISFDAGMYFILVFSVAVASMVDPKELIAASIELIYYPAFVIFGSLLLQSIISRFTKTDADTMIITSTALICSPPFVPVVSSVIKNRNLLVPGISIGLIGYAIGNYLGFVVGEILKLL